MVRQKNPIVCEKRVSLTETMTNSRLPKHVLDENVNEFLAKFDTVFCDCDGVLWLEHKIINKANLVLNKLREKGKRIFFISNNSGESRDEYVKKFKSLGFIAYKDEIINPTYVLAQYLKKKNFNKKVYLVGSQGTARELESSGIRHIGVGPDHPPSDISTLKKMVLDPEVKGVVVDFDENFSIPKLMKAASYLNSPDCFFFATNVDEKLPLSGSPLLFPGTGSLVRAIETVAGRKAEVIGKPSTYAYQALKGTHNIDPKRTIMFGDKYNSDIIFGKRCGFHTCIVMSGVTTWDHIEQLAAEPEGSLSDIYLADYYVESMGTLLEVL